MMTDVLAFYALRWVSASSYVLLGQSQMIFIVLIRRCFLAKRIFFQEFVAIFQLVLGVTMFQLAKTLDGYTAEEHLLELYGILVVILRASLKAADIVFVEWFTHEGLGDLTFYEKQSFVSMWFILSSFVLVVIVNGGDILSGRSLFDGWDIATVLYVAYSTTFSIAIYIVIKKMDSVRMGIITLLTVPTTVVLDVLLFGSKMTLMMALCLSVVLTALLQYKLTEWSRDRVKKEDSELLGASTSIQLGRWEQSETPSL